MSLSSWFSMHAEDVALAEAGKSKVVFWGDSITQGWKGTAAWEKHFAPMGAVNFGIGGDMTQNLLWRLDNGSTGNLEPERIVLLIGTNNFGLSNDTPPQVAEGVRAVVCKLRDAYPEAEILLMAVYPRGKFPDDPHRSKIKNLNRMIQPLDDLEKVTYLDIGNRFLLDDGILSWELMYDYVHLTDDGYAIWAQAIIDWMDGLQK